MVKVLFIGDIVSIPGCNTIRKILPKLKSEQKIDIVIANAENSASGNGMSKKSAMHLLDSGCDILTGGNHSFKRHESYNFLNESEIALRPANFPRSCPGKGFCIYDKGRFSIAVINLIGRVYLEPNNSPFEEINKLLKKIDTPLVLVDFHAEATSEKGAMAYYLDGRVSAVVGTHTHVQTNDARILKNGTGFITDVGMVGPYDSILGVDASCIIRKLTTNLPTRFEVKDNQCIFNAVILELDEITGKCEKISALSIIC